MTEKDIEAKSKSELCRRAEKIARQGSYLNSADLAALSPEESRQVLHDLQVHQIELELQNEELLRVQEALVAARVRYVDLYDLAPVGYCSVNQRAEILEANLTVAKLLNVPRAELVGQPMTRFIFAEDQDVYYRHRQQRHNPDAGGKWCELRLVRKGQAPFWARLEETVSPPGDGGLVSRLVINDITDRKAFVAEQDKLQAQKMAEVGRLAGGVAHNYNNLLGVILGYAELGLELVDTHHPVHSPLQAIQMAAERCRADLTRQLLAFARRQVAEPEVLDLNQVLVGIQDNINQLIGDRIELVWNPGTGLAAVYLDPAQIGQIMAILAANARDAIERSGTGRGTLAIATDNVILDARYCAEHPGATPGEYVCLSVRDGGCGMDHAALRRLFEPFYTTKTAGQGTGLGLAVVYGVIKQNGGYVAVASEPGRGTIFDLYFPRFIPRG